MGQEGKRWLTWHRDWALFFDQRYCHYKEGYFMIWLPVWLREYYMLTWGDQSVSVVFTGQPF